MKNFLPIAFFLLLAVIAKAQNTDSLYGEIASFFSRENTVPVKCGFKTAVAIKLNNNKYATRQRISLDKIFDRPSLQTSIEACNGKFTIHYDTTGENAPNYSIEKLAEALDTVCFVEFQKFGFPFPPEINGNENSTYDIYVKNIGNVYGFTMPEQIISENDSTYTSYIIINSDFSGFYTEGINAAKVTLAHELHHAVQIGNYILRYKDLFFYELTSTSMEEFVFPYVNDYIAYLPEYFNNTNVSFPLHSGYDLGIWNLFLQKRFGNAIFENQWEFMKTNRAVNSINASLSERGASFLNELKEFGVWTFFTAYRTYYRKYFEDAEKFPELNGGSVIKTSFPPSREVNSSLPPMASVFVRSVAYGSLLPDTLTLLVANGNFDEDVFSQQYETNDISIVFFDDAHSGEFLFSKNYSFDLSSSDPDEIKLEEFLNGDFPGADKNSLTVFPSPFLAGKHSRLTIKLNEPAKEAEVSIFDINMNLVKKFTLNVFGNGTKINIEKNYLNLPSGIYIFTLYYNEKTQKGKFAIINARN